MFEMALADIETASDFETACFLDTARPSKRFEAYNLGRYMGLWKDS